jgi:hypothetical protein
MNFETAFEQTGTSKYIHNYHHFYEKMFDGFVPESMLEVGVQRGFSLKSWKMVWPNAIIEGVDLDGKINPKYSPSIAEEFTIYNFNSLKPSDVSMYIDRKYDLIIDDGDHHWAAQMSTFENLRNYCNKYYVIEDICGQYSQDKIYSVLPEEIIERSTLFEATGPTRTFQHSSNIEIDAQYRILFIDLT